MNQRGNFRMERYVAVRLVLQVLNFTDKTTSSAHPRSYPGQRGGPNSCICG